MNNKIDYRELLERQKLIINPIGTSMNPIIKEEQETVLLSKIDRPLKRLDVALFDRPNGKHVLHRILKVKKNYYVFCGDNQVITEKIPKDMVVGVMEGIYHGETYVPITDKDYIKYSKARVRSRKWRFIKWVLVRIYVKIFKKKKQLN